MRRREFLKHVAALCCLPLAAEPVRQAMRSVRVPAKRTLTMGQFLQHIQEAYAKGKKQEYEMLIEAFNNAEVVYRGRAMKVSLGETA